MAYTAMVCPFLIKIGSSVKEELRSQEIWRDGEIPIYKLCLVSIIRSTSD